MTFKELVSISGLPGLYQLVATKSDGAIVKSIDDNVTKFVAARSHSVTALDGIEVFTTSENVRLLDVFMIMKGNRAAAGELDMAKANNNDIKAYYGKLFPAFDADRVYVSDMKKMIKWFGILDAKGLLTQEPTATETVETSVEPTATEKPKKTKAPKAEVDAAVEAKPKKSAKKKTEEKTED
jgi:Domain of unknown function (DUF5606)